MSSGRPREIIRSSSAGQISSSAGSQQGRRPIQHSVRVRSGVGASSSSTSVPQVHSAGAVRPIRLMPGLSAASQRRISQDEQESRRRRNRSSRTAASDDDNEGEEINEELLANADDEIGGGPRSDPLLDELLDSDDEKELEQRRASSRASNQHSVPRSITSSVGVRSYVTAASSVSSLSIKSLSLLEKELGCQLPLSRDGSRVVLSKEDVGKIRDPDTLKFLQEFGALFVKQGRDIAKAEKEVDAQQHKLAAEPTPTSPPRAGVDASELAATMEQLQLDISTFITATDAEGAQYAIPTDGETGLLEVPLENAEEGLGVGDDNGVDLIEDLERDLQELLANQGQNQNQNAGGGEEEGGETEGADQEKGANDPDTEEDFQRKLNELLSPEEEMRILLGDAEQESTKEDKPHENTDGDESTALAKVPTPPKPKQSTFAFKSTWCNKPKAVGGAAASSDDGSGSGTGSGNRTTKRDPLRQRVGNRSKANDAVAGPTKALQKDSFYRLDKFEEERVAWILDNPGWETQAMTGSSECNSEQADNDGGGSVASSSKLSAASSTASKLGYDRASAASYAPSDGYRMDKPTQARLQDIDAKLEKLMQLRSKVSGAGGVPQITDLGIHTPSLSPSKPSSTSSSAQSSPSGTPKKKKSSKDENRSPSTSSVPSTSRGGMQQQRLFEEDDVERRQRIVKEKSNDMLRQMKEQRVHRQQVGALNDKLRDISSQLDYLSTPPFALEVQYNLEQDPASFAWPAEISPPTEDAVQQLLAQAREEQELYQAEFAADDATTPPTATASLEF